MAAAPLASVLRYRAVVVYPCGWLVSLASVVVALAACGEVTHERLDDWKNTEQGPSKLVKVVESPRMDAPMRAHAAENLLAIGEAPLAMPSLAGLPARQRFVVIAPLIERLWQRARVTSLEDIPTAAQVDAKDWLVQVRAMASMQSAAVVDRYLLDWYATPNLEARATLGHYDAVFVMAMLGESAGPRMRASWQALLARPTAKNTYVRLGDELMAAVAATRDPTALRELWQVALTPRGDATLPRRWMSSLHRAMMVAETQGAVTTTAVASMQAQLINVARQGAPWSSVAAQQALDLLAMLPPAQCAESMSDLVAHYGANQLAWVASGYLVQCRQGSEVAANELGPVAERLAVAGTMAPALGGRFVPGLDVLRRVATHREARVRWMVITWLGVCAQQKGVAADVTGCQQLLRDQLADHTSIRVGAKAVTLGEFSAQQLGTPP